MGKKRLYSYAFLGSSGNTFSRFKEVFPSLCSTESFLSDNSSQLSYRFLAQVLAYHRSGQPC